MYLKSADQVEIMRKAGKILADLFEVIESEVKPGVRTRQLDKIAEDFITAHKALPAFKGYQGYPSTICASVNEQVVHGLPGERQLQNGDIIGIDIGVKVQGFFSDAARTYAVGEPDRETKRLLQVTKEALYKGIEKAVEGNRLSDISWAIQTTAERNKFSVVRQYVGHGIGRELHEEPEVPNFGKPGQGPELLDGMTLAIEPMVNAGAYEVVLESNGWTVVTKDRKRSCHFEHTICVRRGKAEILTE